MVARGAVAGLVLVAAAACSKADQPPPEPAPPPPPEPAPKLRTTVRWSNVVRTDGCFFFSGPDGRDDQLVGDVVAETVERDGDRLRLKIGTAIFDGTYADGELSLSRRGEYDYDGPWDTTERIAGRYRDGSLAATYRYEECERAYPRECPGRCTVTGTITFSREP